MEQERTIFQVKDVSKLTGEMLLKMLAYMVEYMNDQGQRYMKRQRYGAETRWNQFMASDSAKEVKTFLNNEVNLDKLKDYLAEYKIGFATQNLKDNRVMLAFEVKNKELVKEAYERFLNNLTSPQDTKKLNQDLLKSPENMNLEEKITHFKVQEQVKIQAAVQKEPKIIKPSPSKEVSK
ncbi:hypothetical protein [Streptococcus sanguinis]|uniref:hypothetical protein n=1 Tax=Streptococcus sanguinis TaxID=1305 RepID=UPI001CBC1E9B|nr:hypothetical protein [Streptococcus sanguinis]MBZ2021753.1 hypothetical protein [Streptococcus sanguinis]MCC3164627.1 hypothetical protein [Streptococcus sanguinis]